MASAKPVDDSFLDEVDDSFLDETPATKSDAAPMDDAPPPADDFQTRARKLLAETQARNGKTLGMDNEALLAGMVRIPALGFRQDLGQFGAALMDKAMGSEIPFGDLVKRAKPQVEKYYGDLESEHPIASGVGTAIGGTPMAMAVNPATAGVSKLASATKMAPWLAKTLGIGAAGLDNAAMAGALRFNETGDTDKAIEDAKVAGMLGAGFAAAPTIYQGAKAAIGKGAQLPRKGIDSLAKMLAPADDAAAPIAQAADNVIPIRPDQADVETKITPIRNFLRDADGSMYMGGKGPKYKTKEEALRKIFDASGVDGMRNQSAKAGHFNEIERIVGRKVKGTQDAFNALSAMSAKKRGKSISDRDWEDVQTAIRELKQIEGLEDLKLPVDVQEALLPVQAAPDVPPVDEPSFNFGFNAKAKAKDPDFLAKSQELADMLAQDADTAITPVDVKPNSIHENATPNQIQDGANYAEKMGLDPNVPLSAQPGAPHIKHKGAYRDKGYSFPQDKAGWENEPHWWKAGEDDSEPSGGIMEMMMRETETPQEAAAWEALNRNERNASKWRNPSDVDSSVGRKPSAFPDPVPMSSFDVATKPRARASADIPTNAKGGGADLYDPMGIGDAPNVRPSDAELFADVRAKAAAAGKPDFSTARDATAGEEALWGEALNRMRAKGLLDNVEEAGRLGTHVATDPGAPFPDPLTMTKLSPDNTAVGGPAIGANRFAMPAPPMPPPGPMPGNDAAQIASGKDRIRELLGKFGKYSGAAGGFKAGGIMGAIGGAQVGAKSAPRTFDMMDKGADKLHALGQKLLTDPAKLMQLEQQGGQMGKAASFVMEGAKTGGEAAMAARAYIIASQPWWRSQFAEDEQEANQY